MEQVIKGRMPSELEMNKLRLNLQHCIASYVVENMPERLIGNQEVLREDMLASIDAGIEAYIETMQNPRYKEIPFCYAYEILMADWLFCPTNIIGEIIHTHYQDSLDAGNAQIKVDIYQQFGKRFFNQYEEDGDYTKLYNQLKEHIGYYIHDAWNGNYYH